MKYFATFVALLTLCWSQTGFATDSRISLTASDGSGLELRQLEARVVLDGFLAFTELEMVFYNPENRRREGRFQIILPDNAAISRFAMKIGEQLQEGEVVEKQLARRAYEDFLHRRQDPALLETDSGNRFNARIFPIEPKSEKLLILSYSQRLAGEESEYVLPLKGLPQLKQLAIKVFYDSETFGTSQVGELTGTVSKREVLSIDKRNYQPSTDFRMPYQAGAKQHLAMQNEQLLAARIIPFTDTSDASKQGFDNLILLIDTSASQAPYLPDSLQRLTTLLPQLQVGTLQVYTFDQTVRAIGTANTLTAQINLIKQVQSDNALGASRLDATITTLQALPVTKARLLLISDTVITAGETSATALATQLQTIPGLERVDILIPSYHSDQKMARRLAKAGQSPGIVAPLSFTDAHIIRKLTNSVYADIPIKVSGSSWFWPETVEALQTNEPLIVFAELAQLSPGKTVRIRVGDKNLSVTSKPANPILLKREWVRARLDKLLDMEDKTPDKDLKNAFHNEIINLSVKERVLSPYTSLLVLETENDYRRYNIDRKGLADILTIGVDGITVIKRTGREIPQPMPLPEPVPMTRGAISKGITLAQPEIAVDSDNALPSTREESDDVARENVTREMERERFSLRYSARDSESPRNEPTGIASTEVMDETALMSAEINTEAESIAHAQSGESSRGTAPPPASPRPSLRSEARPRSAEMRSRGTADHEKKIIAPWTGRYAEFRALLEKSELKAAGELVQQWHQDNLADVMALLALAEWYEKTGDTNQAARAYGSLIDYFPARADIRRWAAERLLAIQPKNGLSLDSLQKAVEQRPDHPSGHYLLAIAYWENEQYQNAVETLQVALKRNFPRFAAAKRILKETLALMLTQLQQQQQLETLFAGKTFNWDKVTQRQLRLILMWETDANDVDFHIYDKQQNHAYYSHRNLASGGTLYADITTGYGPECFTISDPKAFPYKVQAHYYRMGPMGYGMGVLHILRYEPNKGLHSEFRPFVVMKNSAFVALGQIKE